jgi:hypothetical protein
MITIVFLVLAACVILMVSVVRLVKNTNKDIATTLDIKTEFHKWKSETSFKIEVNDKKEKH